MVPLLAETGADRDLPPRHRPVKPSSAAGDGGEHPVGSDLVQHVAGALHRDEAAAGHPAMERHRLAAARQHHVGGCRGIEAAVGLALDLQALGAVLLHEVGVRHRRFRLGHEGQALRRGAGLKADPLQDRPVPGDRLAKPRLGGAATVLLFASPILWWINKAHTEPYVFAMVTIAMVYLVDRPWWSLVAAGAAAAQTPPLLFFCVIVGLASIAIGGLVVLKDRRWLVGAAAGALLASIQPMYFLIRYGTPYLLVDTTQPGMPSLAETAAPLVDPNIGLIPNAPGWAIATMAARAASLASCCKVCAVRKY